MTRDELEQKAVRFREAKKAWDDHPQANDIDIGDVEVDLGRRKVWAAMNEARTDYQRALEQYERER